MYRLGDRNRQIRDMFSAISKRYDFLNRLLSFGLDASWRRKAVGRVLKSEGGVHLDLACGTADLGLELVRQIGGAEVIAADISHRMLEEARKKVKDSNVATKFRFVACPGESLPFREGAFDSILIAFGIRNVVERELALKEMARTLKAEGKLVILEFSLPSNRLMKRLYLCYFQKLLPLLAGIFSDKSAYAYLTESVLDFPEREDFKDMMVRSGFCDVSSEDLTFGIVTIYTGSVRG